jgi:integrase
MVTTPNRKDPPRTPAGAGPADGPPRGPARRPTARPGRIVPDGAPAVKPPPAAPPAKPRGPGRPRSRRQAHGSAWHWRQTDCWYYTPPGTRRRVPLFDADGRRIRGKDNKEQARLALARVKLTEQGDLPAAPLAPGDWVVARVCSEYLQYCERGVAHGSVSPGHRDGAARVLNDLCRYCGALPVAQLRKAHVRTWAEGHAGWKSPATQRSALTVVIAAFNHCQEAHDLPNPLKGLKKPAPQPRLHSLSAEDEAALLGAVDQALRDFLFAAIHTGLRPFCELARLTAEDVEEVPRGMLWRVYASKTGKTRKVPVRPEVAALTRRLLAGAPRGSGLPLFRTTRGKAWQKVNGVVRFGAARRKLGWDRDPVRRRYSCYSCRHTFAHRMLSGYWTGGVGCSVETLAELIGDTPKVAFDHYGREWGQHYQAPLWAALGVGNPPGPEARTACPGEPPARPTRPPSARRSRQGRPAVP